MSIFKKIGKSVAKYIIKNENLPATGNPVGDILVSAKEIYDKTQGAIHFGGKKYFIVEKKGTAEYTYLTVIPWDKRNKKPYKQEDLVEFKVKNWVSEKDLHTDVPIVERLN